MRIHADFRGSGFRPHPPPPHRWGARLREHPQREHPQRELLRRELDSEPLLLLDDVLSELDPARQDFVLNRIDRGQVFITCCEKEKLTQLGRVFVIDAGSLKEE